MLYIKLELITTIWFIELHILKLKLIKNLNRSIFTISVSLYRTLFHTITIMVKEKK